MIACGTSRATSPVFWPGILARYSGWYKNRGKPAPHNGSTKPATRGVTGRMPWYAHSSRDDVVDHIARHICQPEVAAAVPVSELGVIYPQ
jgi:hypothetical protein